MAGCFCYEDLQRRVGSGIEVGPDGRDPLEVLLEHGRTLLWAKLDNRHGFRLTATTQNTSYPSAFAYFSFWFSARLPARKKPGSDEGTRSPRMNPIRKEGVG